MVVMRLARVGRKKLPLYRVVVADKRRAATGKFVDIIGRYNPHTKDIVLDKDKVGKWLKVGAQPSNTVAKLFQIDGVDLPSWVKVKQKNKAVKNEEKAQERANKGIEEKPEEQPQADEVNADIVVDTVSVDDAEVVKVEDIAVEVTPESEDVSDSSKDK